LPKYHKILGPGFFVSGRGNFNSLLRKVPYLPMYRILDLSLLSNWRRLIALSLFILSLQGCAVMKSVQEKSWLSPSHPEKEIERNKFPVAKGDDVIGRLAVIRLEKGDTVPEAGERIMLPLSFILPDAPRKGIVVNLATMRLFEFKGDSKSPAVSTYPVGVGTEERPTPTGQMRVVRKTPRPTWHVPASIAADHRKKGDILPAEVPPGPENPLGEYALYLSKSGYLIHGTNKPASIGLEATNGCMRLYPENIKMLYSDTPVNTPVAIVNQPYLIGRRDGVLYMEAHTPLEGSGAIELEKIYAKLRNIEKKYARKLDWGKIKEVQTEARGIPVPIFEMRQGSEKETPKPMKVEHPDKLYGKPEIPELNMEAWYVLAADVRDKIDALRLAAIINHQGPQIPARVLSKSNSYRVIAGPFNDISDAKDAAKRLKFDLDIDGILIEPVKKG
jgi:L,D-transpeptidase ErfK/SrfK